MTIDLALQPLCLYRLLNLIGMQDNSAFQWAFSTRD